MAPVKERAAFAVRLLAARIEQAIARAVRDEERRREAQARALERSREVKQQEKARPRERVAPPR